MSNVECLEENLLLEAFTRTEALQKDKNSEEALLMYYSQCMQLKDLQYKNLSLSYDNFTVNTFAEEAAITLYNVGALGMSGSLQTTKIDRFIEIIEHA